MADNNRNQGNDQQRNSDASQDQRSGQEGQRSNTSSQGNEEQNPQEGSAWSNYQTRELGSEQGGGEGNATVPHDTE